MPTPKGFEAYEIVEFSFPNLNFGDHDPATAQRLVREGKGRWAWCWAGALTFVPVDYELRMGEHFLRETSRGFEVI